MKREPGVVIWHGLAGLLLVVALYYYFFGSVNAGNDFPQKPIQVVVPFNPGGASDTFVRIIQKGIKDNNLMPHPLVVVNKEGGGTSIGSSYVASARSDGYTVLCLHEALLTAKVSGQSPYGPDSFEKVAATGEIGLCLVVSDSSAYRTLPELMSAARDSPETIMVGVNLNTPTHYAGIILENTQQGTRFRFVSTGGGGNRLASLMGGHLDVAFFSVSEYLRFRENGLTAIAYLGVDRHPGIPDVPTAGELGFPAVNDNLQYWWFPKGTDREIIDYFIDTLKQAMETKYVKSRLDELKIRPVFLIEDALQARIDERMKTFERLSVPNRVELPNIVAWVGGVILLAGLGVVRKILKELGKPNPGRNAIKLRVDLAVWSMVLLFVYILIMSFGIVPFVWATLLFVAFTGLMLTGMRRDLFVYVAEVSLLASFGVHSVFTQVFSLTLP